MSPRVADPGVKELLLEAARVEFARRGFASSRVEDICRRAGVSKGAFYLHHRTKEDIFREILQRFLGVLEEHAKKRKETIGRFEEEIGPLTFEDISRRSRRFLLTLEMECSCDEELLELFWRNRQIVSALDGASGKWYWQLVNDFRRRMSAIVAGNVLAGRTAGRLPSEIDPEFVADVVVGAYEAFVRRMVSMDARPDLEGWAHRFTSMFYEGIQGVHQRPRGAASARNLGKKTERAARSRGDK